ncbi:Hepatocyte cell adhesion molecule [Chelonia mydas]|uniref:Hepatocyte cell adhesion molecule n=1 Tax=Chelonia mydas TaxID=8469 RepID=M7B4F8_CHEMY|nr:Hepatocyte cell adhesion molecule [Chelonia mydas]
MDTVLLVAFQWTSEAARPLERKAAAVGSSVLLSAPDNIKDINFIQWEYLNGTTWDFIVQYYVGSQKPTLYAPYGDRVIFYSLNGSLLLEKLHETDSRVYKASINLIESEARTTLLKVLRPVSQPQIWSNSSLAGSPIELFCNVPEGTVENIDWEKDGDPLPQERYCLLSGSPSVLHIGKGEKSDCGSYSCNVSNEISWQESSLNLTIVRQRVILDSAAPGAVILVVLFASLLLQKISRLQAKQTGTLGSQFPPTENNILELSLEVQGWAVIRK